MSRFPSTALSSLPLLALTLVFACGDDQNDAGADEVGSTADSEDSGSDESADDTSSGERGENSADGDASDASADDTSSGSESAETSSSEDSADDTSSDSESSTTDGGSESDTTTETSTDESDTTDTTGGNPLWTTPSLWYSVEDQLVYIDIDESDGSVIELVASTITTPLIDGQNGLTMLDDGSLIGSRESPGETQIFWIPEPPTDGSDVEATVLGVVPDGLRIEALYTDCAGLVYLMDTGVDVSDAEGNRLIRFTGDYLGGDLSYEVITDLGESSVADIDDMSPGIDGLGGITDGTGFAIDSGTVYDFDYNFGTGVLKGQGGTWGVHALGGPLFDDGVARLYLLDIDARLFEASPADLALSPVLITGPEPAGDAPAGWSGLAGPLTECETTIDPQ